MLIWSNDKTHGMTQSWRLGQSSERWLRRRLKKGDTSLPDVFSTCICSRTLTIRYGVDRTKSLLKSVQLFQKHFWIMLGPICFYSFCSLHLTDAALWLQTAGSVLKSILTWDKNDFKSSAQSHSRAQHCFESPTLGSLSLGLNPKRWVSAGSYFTPHFITNSGCSQAQALFSVFEKPYILPNSSPSGAWATAADFLSIKNSRCPGLPTWCSDGDARPVFVLILLYLLDAVAFLSGKCSLS